MAHTTKFKVRWLIRRDLPFVLDIERQSEENPWCEDAFLTALRTRNIIGMVVEDEQETMLGFMIYELQTCQLGVLKMVTLPGRTDALVAMVDRLKDKLSQQRRNRLKMLVPEYDLAMQMQLKELGFRATGILKNQFESADGYEMVYCVTAENDVYSPWHPTNRMTEYLS